jgi:putative aldouronate transport system substrate-binding protein
VVNIEKKFISLVITGTLAALLLSGCSKTEKVPTSTNVGVENSTKDEKKPNLKVLGPWMQDDYNTYPVAKMLEERTGYHVEYEMLPADKAEDKLNIIMASGTDYDMITTVGGNVFKGLYSDYAKRGALVELTPLIDKYGANVKAVISQASFDAVKVDGKIYSIPMASYGSVQGGLMVRQDWLEKLNIKMPTTVDEFTDMLKAFKQKDPGGNGTDKNIPFSLNGASVDVTGVYVINLTGAFGIPNPWNLVNGKVVSRVEDQNTKEYISYMSELYKQGLLEKEFATNKSANLKEKFTNGRTGVAPISWADAPSVMDAMKKNFPDAKVAYISTLKGKGGKFGLSATPGLDRIPFIPKTSKNAEHTMKWINAKLEKETLKLTEVGQEGVHYTLKDGAYFPILPKFTDERGQANNYVTGYDDVNHPIYWQARVRKDQRLFDAYDFLNYKQPQNRVPDVLGLAPYLPEYTKNNSQLTTMVSDYAIKVIVGGQSLDGFDAFVQKWKEAGGEASSKEINAWYPTAKK